MEVAHIIKTKEPEEYSIDRYDILMALMKSSQTQDTAMRKELSKLIKSISISERKTKQYVNSINIKVDGNEKLLEYIKELA